jgi:hypothetical protein
MKNGKPWGLPVFMELSLGFELELITSDGRRLLRLRDRRGPDHHRRLPHHDHHRRRHLGHRHHHLHRHSRHARVRRLPRRHLREEAGLR